MRGLKDVRNRWGDALSQERWDKFERLLADYYRGQGFEVEHTGTGSKATAFDGGIDLKLRKDGRYVVVQCKHWNAKQVPHNEVHQLIGVMATERATDAVLITSGEFTAYARESAAKVGNIELIDGGRLREMLGPLLPEPPKEAIDESPWQPVVEKYTGVAVDAVVERFGGRRRKSAARYGAGLLVLKGLVPLILFVVGMLFLNRALNNLTHTARAQAAQPAQSSSLPAPSATLPNPPVVPIVGRQLSDYVPPPPKGAKKLMIAEIGSAEEMMTPEELEEWKRKNAESMKVLEANTREIQR